MNDAIERTDVQKRSQTRTYLGSTSESKARHAKNAYPGWYGLKK